MAITFVSAQHERVINDRDTDPALTSVQDDDLILTFAFSDDDNSTHTWDTGVTELESLQDATGQDMTVGFAWKIASSEGATQNIDFADSSSVINTGAILILRGVDTVVPFDQAYVRATHLVKRINDTTPTCLPIDTVTNGAWAIAVQYTRGGDISDMVIPSSGATWNERDENNQPGASFNISTALIAVAGTTTPGSQAHAGILSTDETMTIILAIRPGAVAANVYVPTLPQLNYRHTGRFI